MKRLSLIFVLFAALSLLSGCDVHEFPELPEKVALHLRLSYETNMTVWKHLYEDSKVIEHGLGIAYDNALSHGKIHYVIRAYPLTGSQRSAQDGVQEFVFTKDIAKGYDHGVTLDLTPGDYDIMVWSDLVENDGGNPFYEASDFAEITLQGDHKGNNDYRDAFRGSNNISLVADIMEHLPDTLDIAMQRPLAKFEFVTNDVVEFIDKESTRIASKANGNKAASTDDTPTRALNIEDYKVVFYYVGFMPHAYSMHTDKPVDSSTGVMFESTLKKLSESEASMGFDYVFVNSKKSAVTVQIGIYDNEGTQLSLTEPIEVPLKRSHHTIITGMFLMSEASGGVTINPDFDGDHNLIFP